MKSILVAACAVLSIVGCGSQHSASPGASRSLPAPPQPAPFVCRHKVPGHPLKGCEPSSLPIPQPQTTCHHRVPAQAGECIRQRFGVRRGTPLKSFGLLPLGAFHATGIDISVYQGVPSFFQARLAGLRLVIVQTNDGFHRNPSFYAQVRAIRGAGLPWGFYTFTEAFSGATQAAIAVQMAAGQGATLGAWTDVEVPGSYGYACEYVNYARVHGYRIVGKYSSPGLVEGGACIGYDWPAEWSGGSYPLRGYSYAQTVVRQNCGTCRFSGVSGEVDRDEDLGLLALAKPGPTHAEVVARWHRELKAHAKLRRELHGLIEAHRCRLDKRGHGHEIPRTHRQWEECRTWIAHGQLEITIERSFHQKGIW
jgi:hypothetical protein